MAHSSRSRPWSRLLVLIILPLLAVSLADWASAQTPETGSAMPMAAELQSIADGFDYPVGKPDARGWTFWHGYENFGSVYAGAYHAGEDWCTGSNGVCDGRAAGHPVYAVGNGVVRYASGSYPGNVVIVEHRLPNGEIWYSMYGHVVTGVSVNQTVSRGQQIAKIFDQAGNSHLHFEIRRFYVKDEINGANAACSRHRSYPPGPGYWPVCGSSGKPSEKGWVNPSQFIKDRRQISSTATEVICDSKSSCFSKYESSGAWGYVQPGTGDSSSAYNQHAYWTFNGQNQALDWGKWTPDLPRQGTYNVYIWYPHYPGYYPETGTAHYQVHHAEGNKYLTWNQATNYKRWNKIATVNCPAGRSCYVKLTDETHEGTASRRVWFDAVKFELVEAQIPADTVEPDGKITAPLNGQNVNSSRLTFSAEAWDNNGGSGVDQVQFNVYYNGTWRKAGTDSKAPYAIHWTPPADLGAQQLQFAIHVFDKAGNRRIDPGGIIKVNFKPSTAPDNGFKLPYPGGASYMTTQGNHSNFSHSGQYAYAFDFGMPRGHNVVAARNGRVVSVKGNSRSGGCSSWYMPYANFIRIRHIDGSDTVYVHLDSVSVRQGQYVRRGQVIGKSGQTGWSCGAHLHFDRRKSGGSWTIATRFLDVSGGVPRTGGWYRSGNYLGRAMAAAQEPDQVARQQASDTLAPIGSVQFHTTGELSYTLWLAAEDETSELDAVQMRLAAESADLEAAEWQTFAGEVTWNDQTVWVQYRDAAGNISDAYADVLDPVATSPLQATFEISPTICASSELPITNQTTPFCEQCQWSWDLGNGSSSIAAEPAPVSYASGSYTLTLTVTGASNASTASRQLTVLPVPDASFEILREGNSVTVTATEQQAASWEWDFGDGTTASGQTASHTYAADLLDAEELPVITLTASNGSECSGSASRQVVPATQHTVYLPLIQR